LHQFISQTGYVYVTLEDADKRYITLEPNPFVKLSESELEVPVFQTVFSRVSGVEFICVRKDFSESKLIFRDFNENQNPKNEDDLKANDGNKVKKVKSRLQDDYKDGYILFDKGYQLDINDFIELLPAAWISKGWQNRTLKRFSTSKRNLCIKGWFIFRNTKWRGKSLVHASSLNLRPNLWVNLFGA
jgi:hypothetical protein